MARPAELRWRGKLLLAVGGGVLALAAAEGLCRWVGQDAFPYLNLFRPDPRFGVVLEAGASTRVRTRSGRIFTVRTNPLGFRGAVTAPKVLLLGDSQVLGYGVDEEQTMAAALGAQGYPALAAAVPSWGPIELAHAAEDWVPRLGPEVVVFFANLGNDWPEANVPNAERSDARDGWLIRRRKDRGLEFPGRRFLLGRSQLVFSARALIASFGAAAPEAMLGAPAADRMLATAAELAAPRGGDRSRLTPLIRRVIRACSGRCRVVVAVLPMDLQVDRSAWAKYRRTPRDLSALAPLVEGLLADLRGLGITAVDLAPALAAASPGAFLDDDPHLSPAGHRVVAAALMAAIRGDPSFASMEVSR